ncbi:MAG: thermosome subunit beta [Candidatus Thermoplasmatota archaeon]|nr:thermosome subunit beta [Candidatus Thermoplasmatota archaeon]
MMTGNTPILILKEGTEREKGRGAQHNNIAAAKAVAEAVRSTLGPKGMDKMLVDSMGDVVITNDGVTILKEIDIEHPAAKMVVEVAKTQDTECGDGTTTAVILAGELLKKAEGLVEQDVHPTVITTGYRTAAQKAIEIIKGLSHTVSPTDKVALKKIASTAMTGKSVGGAKDHLAEVSVQAVISVVEKEGKKNTVDLDNIQIVKKQGGSIDDTQMIEGVILDKERVHSRMPKSVKNAKVALLDAALEIKKTEVEAKIQITDPSQLQKFLDEEERTLRKMVDAVKKSGATVVFCQKGIDDLAQHFLAKEGIFAVRRVKKSDMEKIAKATGANVVTNLQDFTAKDLGKAGLVEEKKVGNDDMTFVTNCPSAKAVSILIKGGTEHVVDEVERALHDALKVTAVAIEDGAALPGGGATEIEISLRLKAFAASVGGREQLAIEAFAEALEVIPRALAENAGLDALDVIIDLKSAHDGKKGMKSGGIDVFDGKVKDMIKENVIEPMRVKVQAIESATDVATMILRIDDVIASKRGAGGPPGGMPGGMGGMGGMGDM